MLASSKMEVIQMTSTTFLVPFVGNVSKDSLRTTLQVIGASLFLAFCAQLALPLYFTPVPLSMQTLGVMLIGGFLGRRKGLLAIATYLLEGSLGFPVFAHGSSGIAYLMGPTGGYFLGFALQAYLIGWWVDRKGISSIASMVSMLVFASAVQLGVGALWLGSFVGMSSALALGFYPFIIGEALKAVGVASYFKRRAS
jgi:biotin transport system substrate-specific component